MTDETPKSPKRQLAIPRSRGSRFLRVARIASGVAGGMLAEGARQVRAGNTPKIRDMLLTPANAQRVAEQLATMRGAAMKVGQMLSMETETLLPKELADILAKLRSDAHTMPAKQLHQVLIKAYGKNWQAQFNSFNEKPIAAASIGQVHRATGLNGEDLALKIQYPGIANSIDSDVDNIASLLRISGLLPEGMDISQLLDEGKKQLHDEANYRKEAKFLSYFSDQLRGDERFIVPTLYNELSKKNILAMEFIESEPIEAIANQPQEEINRVMSALLDLSLQEFFSLRMVQTDPNFANYQYRSTDQKIVLLDFGATKKFKLTFVNHYKRLLKAAIAGDDAKLIDAAEKLGYTVNKSNKAYQDFLTEVFYLALEPFTTDDDYDFAQSDLPARLVEISEQAKQHKDFWHTPPTDVLYLHRKLGGMFLLATRLKASVNTYQLVNQWI